ncbi:MAG TPA: SufD family Fe-S cluster assembly protein, partial [Limnochordia bacterium]
DGARVRYAAVQNLGQSTFNLTVRRAVLGRDASVEWVVGEFGSRTSRTATVSVLAGSGSESKSIMVFFGDGAQHLDLSVTMQHVGAFTTGEMLAKGAVGGRARVIYRGLTDIEHGAENASAFQRENTLILSKDARSDAIPGLEIDDNRVQAGHAATVGQVDELLLFYLMSRGLSRRVATKLIVDGFFDPIMQRVPLAAVKDELQRLIDGKMLG